MRVTKQSSQSLKKKKKSVPHALVTLATAARGSRPALGWWWWWFATRLFVTARAGRRKKLGPRFWRQNLKASRKKEKKKTLHSRTEESRAFFLLEKST